jgi:ribosomal protein S18 acetylase RimI-like enzyme
MAVAGPLRRLWADERGKVCEHLLRLDGEDRLRRFAGYFSDAQIETYCASLDWGRALIVGYVVDGEVRAIGELKPMPDGWSSAAELAVSVERRFQNRGVGTALLRRLIVAARNRFIPRLRMICLMDNARVQHLARKLDGRLIFDQGEVEARIEPPWPTWWTLLEETVDATPVPAPVPHPPLR